MWWISNATWYNTTNDHAQSRWLQFGIRCMMIWRGPCAIHTLNGRLRKVFEDILFDAWGIVGDNGMIWDMSNFEIMLIYMTRIYFIPTGGFAALWGALWIASLWGALWKCISIHHFVITKYTDAAAKPVEWHINHTMIHEISSDCGFCRSHWFLGWHGSDT